MTVIFDTNVIYNIIGINPAIAFKNKSQAMTPWGFDWLISDISLLEGINFFNRNASLDVANLIAFFQANSAKYIEFLGSNDDLKGIVCGAKAVDSNLINKLIAHKINMETDLIFDFFQVFIDINTARKIETSKLESIQNDIWKYIMQMMDANVLFMKELIRDVLTKFYADEDESAMKSRLRVYLYMLLFTSEWNFTATKHGLSIGDLRDQLESGKIKDPDITSKQELDRIIANINQEDDRFLEMNTRIQSAIGSFSARNVFKIDLKGGYIEYLKLLSEKLFTSGKKIHKNDLLDARLLTNFPNMITVTADTNLKKAQKALDSSFESKNDAILRVISEGK